MLIATILTSAHGARGAEPMFNEMPEGRFVEACDLGTPLSKTERETLISKLRISVAGQQILADFVRQYKSLKNLVIQWDSVSYSQVAPDGEKRRQARSLASSHEGSSGGGLGEAICVHLAKKLPEIEHVADLAHELTHVTRLEMRILKGEVESVEEFVKTRLGSRGGEADAFASECQVKRELLGHWDAFCAPYATEAGIDVERVIEDFYGGRLSASLTGEAYPVMLARQYRALRSKKAAVTRNSGLENKQGIQ